MKEELINPRTGELAKKKGFNWSCRTIYHPDNLEETSSKIQHLPFNGLNNKVFKKTVSCFTLPTQSLLQRWLRENYNIQITVFHFIFRNGKVMYKYHINQDSLSIYYKTYEEALEEALYEGLKLIT